jgi:hypothetical protein
MEFREIVRAPDPYRAVRADLREVVAEVEGKPHLYHRLQLSGWHFEARAEEPFMLVGRVVSRRVIITPDGLVASGYFAGPIPQAKLVSFGYGRTIAWDFPLALRPDRIRRLDRVRLEGVIIPDRLR